MAIRKIKRGDKTVLVIDIRDDRLPNGRIRKNAEVQIMAQARAEERELRENLVKHGQLEAPEDAGGMTLERYWEDFYVGGTLLGHTTGTQLAYRSVWARAGVGLRALLGHVPLESIDALRMTKARNAVLAAGRSPRGALILLKALLADAVGTRALARHPEYPKGLIKDSEKLLEAPSPEDARKLLLGATGWMRAALALSLHCGLRMGEIRALMVGDIDLQKGLVYVRRALSENTMGTVKNRAQRYIPLAPEVAAYLADAIQGLGPEAPIVSKRNGEPMRRQNFLTQYLRLRAELGMPPESFHKTRHYFATQLLATGADLETARSLTGHHSVSSFERYVHTMPGRRQQAVDRVALGTDWAPTSKTGKKDREK